MSQQSLEDRHVSIDKLSPRYWVSGEFCHCKLRGYFVCDVSHWEVKMWSWRKHLTLTVDLKLKTELDWHKLVYWVRSKFLISWDQLSSAEMSIKIKFLWLTLEYLGRGDWGESYSLNFSGWLSACSQVSVVCIYQNHLLLHIRRIIGVGTKFGFWSDANTPANVRYH